MLDPGDGTGVIGLFDRIIDGGDSHDIRGGRSCIPDRDFELGQLGPEDVVEGDGMRGL